MLNILALNRFKKYSLSLSLKFATLGYRVTFALMVQPTFPLQTCFSGLLLFKTLDV